MAKSKSKEEEKNPFSGFSVIRGEFETPIVDPDDEIKTGDDTIIEEDENDLSDNEKLRMAEADKKLAEQAEKIKNKKSKEEQDVLDLIDEDTENEGEEDNKSSIFKELIKDQLSKGNLDFDYKDEEFEDSEESIDKAFTLTLETKINKWVEALPEDFQNLLEFVQNGGNQKDFLNVYYNNHSWENFSIESEDNQKYAAKEALILSGETPEDAEEIVTEWFDNGTLEKRAKSSIAKLQKFEESQKKEILEIQKQSADKTKKAQKEYWDGFKKDLMGREEIKGFKLTPKLKEKIWDHLSVVDKKTGKTAYQMKLENDTEASLLFALQSAMDFDINKLEKQVESKVSSKIGNVLRNYSKSTKEKISSGTNQSHEDSDPFGGFKAIKI